MCAHCRWRGAYDATSLDPAQAASDAVISHK
jgi:hypothetical protein